MIIRHTVQFDRKPRQSLTAEQIAEIEARAPRDEDIVYDEDCPKMTEEQLRQFRRVDPRTGHAPRPKAAGD